VGAWRAQAAVRTVWSRENCCVRLTLPIFSRQWRAVPAPKPPPVAHPCPHCPCAPPSRIPRADKLEATLDEENEELNEREEEWVHDQEEWEDLEGTMKEEIERCAGGAGAARAACAASPVFPNGEDHPCAVGRLGRCTAPAPLLPLHLAVRIPRPPIVPSSPPPLLPNPSTPSLDAELKALKDAPLHPHQEWHMPRHMGHAPVLDVHNAAHHHHYSQHAPPPVYHHEQQLQY
jgi:hypothetical protein